MFVGQLSMQLHLQEITKYECSFKSQFPILNKKIKNEKSEKRKAKFCGLIKILIGGTYAEQSFDRGPPRPNRQPWLWGLFWQHRLCPNLQRIILKRLSKWESFPQFHTPHLKSQRPTKHLHQDYFQRKCHLKDFVTKLLTLKSFLLWLSSWLPAYPLQ